MEGFVGSIAAIAAVLVVGRLSSKVDDKHQASLTLLGSYPKGLVVLKKCCEDDAGRQWPCWQLWEDSPVI